jgi:hypothetical protein
MVDSFLVGSYISVPQIGNDALFDQQSDLARAVASIPAYIGLCSHFFAVVPTIKHGDNEDVLCDLGTWLDRGWCRIEMYALLLARSVNVPVIVVKGGDAAPYMVAAQTSLSRPPGCGTFTCCARNHRICDAGGVEQTIPCDKTRLGPVVWTMIKALLKSVLATCVR